jgi:transposase-like protein
MLLAADRNGETVDFLLTARRDKKAALRYLKKALGSNGTSSLINIGKSGANTAAIKQYNAEESKRIKIRQCSRLIVAPWVGMVHYISTLNLLFCTPCSSACA